MPTLLAYCLLFTVVGVAFILVHLLIGKIVRPAKPDPEKLAVYECGEPTIGTAWVQFDLRFYVIALLFVIFEVEVAFFFPWAVVFGKLNALGDASLEGEGRQQLVQALVPPHVGGVVQSASEQASLAVTLGWIALVDILIFFGVLLVGYAYLWRRGDLNWVRSVEEEVKTWRQVGVEPPAEVLKPPAVEVAQGA
ncbi:MAG: NADH-quinone oxidoreductase subunit A [Gemmatales bacterium]|nr:NADH-quinone oxidoreductase subunit A [Gemmatales bacterium]MDW8387965.1 NADH-quinone oxidoreductase subunit A [Gemmatales bacterium]